MKPIRYIACAFAMFSRIPVPRSLNLAKDDMRYLLATFPLVGIAIGAVAFLWWWLCGLLGFHDLTRAVGLLAVTFLVAGAIHMDGFVDVCDAISSHAEPQKRREILSDPHVGAFAVICTVLYLLIYCAVLFEIDITIEIMGIIAIIYVFERALSGICALVFPKSGETGMLATFNKEASTRTSLVILAVFAVACIVGMAILNWVVAIFVMLMALIAMAYLHATARKQFGGMSGDLSGFFLQLAELLMFVGILIAQQVVALL